MTDQMAEDCPVCDASDAAKARFAAARVAEHVVEAARRDAAHREWMDEHTDDGTLREVRQALAEHGRPRR